MDTDQEKTVTLTDYSAAGADRNGGVLFSAASQDGDGALKHQMFRLPAVDAIELGQKLISAGVRAIKLVTGAER